MTAKLLALCLVLAVPLCPTLSRAGEQSASDDATVLKRWIAAALPDEALTGQAAELLGRIQVLYVLYERGTPMREIDRDARRGLVDAVVAKGALLCTGIDRKSEEGEVYPGLFLTLSRFHEGGFDAKLWMQILKLPAQAQYLPLQVRIAYSPTPPIKRASFDRSQLVVSKIGEGLDALKPLFKQLQEFDATKRSAGEWEDQEWPQYPRISYRYGFGKPIPGTKGDYEKTTPDWCEIQVYVSPVTGNPRAVETPIRIYARQGIEVTWSVQAAQGQDAFTKEVTQLIAESLKLLGEYERELEAKH